MTEWVMLAFFLSPVEFLVGYCLWSLYKLTKLPRRTVPYHKLETTLPEWAAVEDAYLEIRPMYANLRFRGQEWDQDRKEVLVGVSINGFDVLGDEPVFAGTEGSFDEIAFYDDLYDTSGPKFCLARAQARYLRPFERLVVNGSI